MFFAAAAIADLTAGDNPAAASSISSRVTSTGITKWSNCLAYDSSARSPSFRTAATIRATRRVSYASCVGERSSSAATAAVSLLLKIRIVFSIPRFPDSPISRFPDSHHNLVQRVLNDALRAGRLQARHQVTDRALFDDGVDRHPVGIAQRRDGRTLQRRQQREHGVECIA